MPISQDSHSSFPHTEIIECYVISFGTFTVVDVCRLSLYSYMTVAIDLCKCG